MSQRLRDYIIGLVALVWAVNVTAPLYLKGYSSSAEVNGIFMAIVGVYFARRDGNDKDKKKDSDA